MRFASLPTPTGRGSTSLRALFAAAVVGLCLAAPASHAATLLLGPSPYRSAADSPFPIDGSNPNFFLEDFEDGALNTPGLLQSASIFSQGIVLRPQAGVHSVDGDDGVIDGQGSGGRSLAPRAQLIYLTDPPRTWSSLHFAFDATALGFLPNSFGFVWTHEIPKSIGITLYDSDGGVMASKFINGGGELSAMPSEDDRFIGVTSNVGFAAVEVSSFYEGPFSHFQIDHLQYGLTIPEPASLLPAECLAMTCALTHRRQRHRHRPIGTNESEPST